MGSPSRVRAVLWDADGVLQVDPPEWGTFFADALGERAAEIGTEIFAGLGEALVGRVDMRARVAEVLARHGLGHLSEPVLASWRTIVALPGTRRLVTSVGSASGVASYLATNQDTWRAQCMRELMGYDELLDGAYYSCEIGLAKPDPAYFEHVLADLDLAPEQVAFVDDRAENVAGAASVGLHAIHWHHDHGLDVLGARLAALGLDVPRLPVAP